MSNRINDKAALAVVGSDTNFAVDTPAGVKRVTHAVLQVAAAGVASQAAEINGAGTVAITLSAAERLKFVTVTVVAGVAAYAAVLLLPAAKAGDRVVFALTLSGSGEPVTLRFSQFLAGTVLREILCSGTQVVTAQYDGGNWLLLVEGAATAPNARFHLNPRTGRLYGYIASLAKWQEAEFTADPGDPGVVALTPTGDQMTPAEFADHLATP